MSRVSLHLPSFVGGALCLDFANTVDPRHRQEERAEFLESYERLLEWSALAGLLSAEEQAELAGEADRHPVAARSALARAIALREALYRLLEPSGAKDRVGHGVDAAKLTDEAHRGYRRCGLEQAGDGWGWVANGAPELDQMLWPVARSAVEVLTSGSLGRVRECQGSNGCGWLFIDSSKNGRRRWCDMRVCGNRAKAKRHRQRAAVEDRAAGVTSSH